MEGYAHSRDAMTVALIVRLVLAGVFAVAGVAKLADRKGTRTAVVAFGAPTRIAGALAIAIPVAELAVAGLLLPASTAPVGALGALALLGLFSGAVAVSLARGRAPECHCFGQLHSAPASWRTLVRNAALAGIAVFAIAASYAAPDVSAVAWLGRLDGAGIVALTVGVLALVLVGFGTGAFISLMRSYGRVLVRLDRVEAALSAAGIGLEEDMQEIGLEPGTPAPEFAAVGLNEEPISLQTLVASGKPSLVLFTSPSCRPCKTLLPTAVEWQRRYADAFTTWFAIDATAGEARAEAEAFELDNVLVDEDGALYELLQANGTPGAVVIAADGTIGSWVVSGSEWIERLVLDLVPEPEAEQGIPLGAEAPALELPSLDGERVALADLQGRSTMLLFWNPSCGFCRGMHEELLAWERSTNGVTPRLVVVSSGDAEDTRADRFQSLVLLDPEYAAGDAFGANGTPMAVLLGADGRIASEMAVGSDAVLALAEAAGEA
jgi:thiol-disulfide isomerase/thioredoxin